MARKNKHEKLAKEIQRMLYDINDYIKGVELLIASTFYHDANIIQSEMPIEINTKGELQKIICYFPDKTELSDELDWYESEDERNSFTHQILNIHELVRRDKIIASNLLKDPRPIYELTIQKWQAALYSSGNRAKAPQGLYDLPFAPKKSQTLKQAYESVRTTIKNRELRHRQDLRQRYRIHLEQAIFEGIPMDDPIRNYYLADWEKKIFSKMTKPPEFCPERWPQCHSVDRYTSGDCILWLFQQFLKDTTRRTWGKPHASLVFLFGLHEISRIV